MTTDDLIKVLEQAGVFFINGSDFGKAKPGSDLERDLKFVIKGNVYTVHWYCNLMNLTHDVSGLTLIFDKVVYSNTWPNDFDKSLQFSYGDKTVGFIGVIPKGESDE